ncbi:hypothetical protein ACK8OR_15080 [Jannaschia sp. KMU-145]
MTLSLALAFLGTAVIVLTPLCLPQPDDPVRRLRRRAARAADPPT